jgi:putative chitinase
MTVHPKFANAVKAMAASNADKHVIDEIIASQDTLPSFGVDTPRKIAHFLAQISHESGGFKIAIENMNYSAKRITEVWPKRFKTIAEAVPFAHNPQKLGNKVYANRMGNGPPSSGDGFRYRGRGLLQITGREMYITIANSTGLDLVGHPELAEHFEGALKIACGGWKFDGVDKLPENASVEKYTQLINGGQTGIVDRKNRFALVLSVMGI